MNAAEIKALAVRFNAGYPEAAAQIETGTATLVVSVNPDDRFGRRYRYVATAMVIATDGGSIGTGTAGIVTISRRDGRERMVDCAERLARKLVPVDASIPVLIIDNQR